jgi:hypothetical protein
MSFYDELVSWSKAADKFFGDLLAIPNGLHDIGSGQAAMIGLIVVVAGWFHAARRERVKYRIETARTTLMLENEQFKKLIPLISPYFSDRKQFPGLEEMRRSKNKNLRVALHQVLTMLEVLSLDVRTGRASEFYIIKSQRSIICRLTICSQQYITSSRIIRDEKRFCENLENLFIRIYFNRYAPMQRLIEFVSGKPLFWYSYRIFRLRYLVVGPLFGLKSDYRQEEWPTIKKHMRILRKIEQGIIAALLFVLFLFVISRFD